MFVNICERETKVLKVGCNNITNLFFEICCNLLEGGMGPHPPRLTEPRVQFTDWMAVGCVDLTLLSTRLKVQSVYCVSRHKDKATPCYGEHVEAGENFMRRRGHRLSLQQLRLSCTRASLLNYATRCV